MGIEQFFSSIENNLATNLKAKFFNIFEKNKIEADSLYIDFNSIVHNSSHRILSHLNTVLYRIIVNRRDKLFSDLVAQYDIPDEALATSSDYYSYWTLDRINHTISDVVIQELFSMLETMFKGLKRLFIAVDGVPSKGKMMEQKKRRYMGAVISKVQKKLLDKHKKELKKDKSRYDFEKFKIVWGKQNISPGTEFMDVMNLKLKDSVFTVHARELQPELKEFILSGVYQPGEGEKKFINYIRARPSDETIAIYSPDSDVTLLAMLVYDCVKSCRLVRPNVQKKRVEIINIEKLCANLGEYISNRIDKKVTTKQIILDIVFMFTMFGNDFLPRVESISVRNDFEYLLDRYAASYVDPLIVEDKKGWYKLNGNQFLKLLLILHQNEGGSLQKAYMSANYRNYQQLKKILGAEQSNFNKVLLDFLTNIQKLMRAIKHGDRVEEFKKNKEFVQQLKRVTVLAQKSGDIVEDIKKFYRKQGRFPRFEVALVPRSRKYNNYHSNTVVESLGYLNAGVKATSYDEELYRFNRMLEEYQHTLNAHELELGKVTVDSRTMQWKADKIPDGVNKYYYSFFGIKDIKSKEMDQLLEHYVEGLGWVFNYYYNWYDEKDNHTKALIWFYRYSRAPLLTQLFHWCSNNRNKLDSILNKPLQYVKTEDFFNNVEHLMRVSPAPYIKDVVPSELLKFTKEYPYPNLDQVADRILARQGDEIDCRGIIFLNKCLLKVSLQRDAWNDEKFIKEMRKIKLLGKTVRLAAPYQDRPKIDRIYYPELTTINKVKEKHK